MYLLAGYEPLPLKVFIVHRTLFGSEEEAQKFLQDADLEKFSFLKPMTIQQVAEHVTSNGKDVLLVPVDPIIPEEI